MQRKSRSNTFEDNFRELLNFISDPIMILSQDGVVLATNRTASVLLGLPSEELVGKNIKDLQIINGKTKEIIQNQIQRRLKKGE